MSALAAALARIGGDLDELGRPWALVGALAVAARAEARATLDVDVAVAVADPAEAAALVADLRGRGYRWEADFGTAMTTLAVPSDSTADLRLDLLFSLAGTEDVVARAAERLTVLPGLELPVALRGDLIALSPPALRGASTTGATCARSSAGRMPPTSRERASRSAANRPRPAGRGPARSPAGTASSPSVAGRGRGSVP